MALIAVFCLSVAGLLAGKPLFEACRPYLAMTLSACGVVAWFVGRFNAKRRSPQPAQGEADEQEECEGGGKQDLSLWDLRYWGPMLTLLGVITIFIWPLNEPATPSQVTAAPGPKKVAMPTLQPAPPTSKPVVVLAAPAKFPVLKVQGVIFRAQNPFAIINGASYTVGDRVGDVLVKAIERESVMLELDGQYKVLTLD